MFHYLGQDERLKFIFKSLVSYSQKKIDAQNIINDCFLVRLIICMIL